MLEVGLFDSKINQFYPSLQAVSAIYTAKKYIKFYNNSHPEDVTTGLSEYGLLNIYSADEVKSCARCLNELTKVLLNSDLKMHNQKFYHAKYFEVSRIVAAVRNLSSQQAESHSQFRSRKDSRAQYYNHHDKESRRGDNTTSNASRERYLGREKVSSSFVVTQKSQQLE